MKLRRSSVAALLALSAAGCGASTPRGVTFVPVGPGRGEGFEAQALEIAPSGDCGGLALLPRTTTSLLGGRVSVSLPPADVRGMPHSIMAAEPSREWNELAWIEAGDARMAIVASEPLRMVEGDLAEVVTGWIPPSMTVERGSEDLAAAFASPPQQRGDDVPLARIYVRDADGLVVVLDVITDPRNAERGGCVELARAFASSAIAGTRRVALSARTVTFEGLTLEVPAGFASTIDQGPDFSVLHVDAITRSDDAPLAALGLYAGDHPSFAPGEAPSITRELLGTQVPFFDTNEEGTHRREALVANGPRAYHVFFRASDETLFEMLDAVAATLRAATP
ncbi:MAG: hypothetical protein J0L92_01420 [Deltaproteobacteria bacterium]|nr:hypothetical protein [Deltaproteobacteria bacterium]